MKIVKIGLLLAGFLFLSGGHCAAADRPFDEGTAITDPNVILELNRALGMRTVFGGWMPSENLMYNEQLFLPPTGRLRVEAPSERWQPADLTSVRQFLAAKISEYRSRKIEGYDIESKKVTADVMPGNVLDERFLGRIGRFELVAIINRMDKAYKSPDLCGEVRLIYRLFYEGKLERDQTLVRSRLPMTLNVVLSARAPTDKLTCKDIASRWLQAARSGEKPKAQADRLVSPRGALGSLQQSQLLRLELNVQILRASASHVQDFGTRAEYVLAVFDFDRSSRRFVPAKELENQIDNRGLAADSKLRGEFVDWLSDPDNLREVDSGTVLFPSKFLVQGDADSPAFAVSVSPGGETRSINQPAYDIFDAVAVKQLEKAIADINAGRQPLRLIKSAGALSVRINDLGCTGCHQTRSIAGFHLPGADWRYTRQVDQVNAVSVPGSPHFFGDVPRRRAVIQSLRDGKQPDFQTAFSARPASDSEALKETELLGGWGATCYSPKAGKPADPSFAGWTCRSELTCRVLNRSADRAEFGTCISSGPPRIGDPLQEWKVNYDGFDRDRARLERQVPDPGPPGYHKMAHQEYDWRTQEGGFPNGMLRGANCTPSTSPARNVKENTVCTPIADKGFNDCLKINNFETCIDHCTKPGILRSCSERQPCRDDYICMKTAGNAGACIPPYFVFQFRVDRHPMKIKAISSLENVPQSPRREIPPMCVRD